MKYYSSVSAVAMSNDEMLTDDYVAGLLSQEANDCSLKYSAMGMDAFRENTGPRNVPKPNKRFLRHIIKDTDTHNKALLAKEAAESRARLHDLEQSGGAKRLKTNTDMGDIRRRQMGDIHAILAGGSKEPRKSLRPGKRHVAKSRDGSSTKDRDLLSGSRHSRRSDHGRLTRADGCGDDSTVASRSRGPRHEPSRRIRSPRHGEDRHHRHHRHHRSRGSASPPSSRARLRQRDLLQQGSSTCRHVSRRDDDGDSTRQEHNGLPRRAIRHRRSPEEREGVMESSSDSDPLEEVIGPKPLPQHRGRGSVAQLAGIDRRFSDSYDPREDVPEGDGSWDDAVASYRDRQKLKLHREERLEAAGFTEDLIQRIKAGNERTEKHVTWSKAGERREWDSGKSADGHDL